MLLLSSQLLLRSPSSALWRRGIFTKLACVPCIRSGYGLWGEGWAGVRFARASRPVTEYRHRPLVKSIEFAWLFPSPTKSLEC